MILLDVNTSLEVVLGSSATNQLQFQASYIDTSSDNPGHNDGVTNDTTDVAIVSPPGSDARLIREATIYNPNSGSINLILKTDDGTNERILVDQSLDSKATLAYNSQSGWYFAFAEGYTDSDVDAHLSGGVGISYSSGSISLDAVFDNLNDVDVPAPSGEQVLTYKSGTGNWEAADLTASDVGLGNVENTALSTAGWADMGIATTDVTASDVDLGSVPNEDATDPANWDPAKTDGNFLVGNGSDFVAESGSTVRTSMGLGTAATHDDSEYAPASKGVTNGDSHNHSGGDGAQIAHSSLSGASGSNNYTNTSGSTIIDYINTDNEGHITSISTRNLGTQATKDQHIASSSQNSNNGDVTYVV